MRAYSDAELAEYLGADSIPLDAYSLIGEPGADLAALYLPEIGFRVMIMRNNGLAVACKAFLAQRGARRFRDYTEWQAAGTQSGGRVGAAPPVALSAFQAEPIAAPDPAT